MRLRGSGTTLTQPASGGRRGLRIACLLCALAACARAPSAAPPVDEALLRMGQAGNVAYDLERPKEAAEQYRTALARARERDDSGAIADTGFNLAVAQLRAGEPAEALRTARTLQAELGRRGTNDPAFDLVAATAQFRLGDRDGADRLAARLTSGTTPALADPAWFLRGLIADERGDRAGLDRAAAALGPSADPADIDELRARRLRDRAAALHAADLRRDALDYRGLARALALAASLTPDAAAAADLYLRAGRSAAAQGEKAQAQAWLTQSRARAADPQLREEADRALHALSKS